MSGTVNAGSIVYEVDIETGRLLSAGREINGALGGLNSGVGRLDASVNRVEGSMSSLSKAAQLVAGSLTIGAVIKAADDWGQMAARIKMSLNSVEGDISRYSELQNRFLEVSNRNGKAIETTQALYSGSATSMKELGYNTSQTIDYIESLSSTFTANATSAQQTESAMTALNRSMVLGKLSGNDWHSVLNAIPSAVGDVAKELSRMRGGIVVTENEVKKMAMNGGIDMKLFADAVINAKDANNSLADSMDNTVADGFTKLTNSAKAYYGEMNQAYGITRNMSAGFAVLTSNFDKVATAANIAAVVIGARMASSFAASTKAKISDIAASANQARAEAATAKAAEYAASAVKRKAVADKEAALSAQALFQAELNVAKGSNAEMIALNNLVAAKTRARMASIALAEAETAQAAATARAAAAARAASLSFGLARGALSLIGGPAGAAMLAASAIFYFWEKAQQAKQEAIAFADGLDKLNASMKSMSNTQLRGAIADANDSIIAQKSEIKDLEGEIESLSERYRNFTPESQRVAESLGNGSAYASEMASVSRDLDKKIRDLADKQEKLSKTTDSASEANRLLTNNMLTSMGVHEGLIEKGSTLERVQGAVARAFGNTADEINRANMAGQNFKPSSLSVDPATEAGDKYNGNLEEQNQLLKIQDERLRAVTKARLDQQKVTSNPNQIAEAERLAGENYDLKKAQEGRSKAAKDSESQDKRSAASADSVAQKLESLRQQSDLAADSARELTRAQAIQRAKDSLGKSANPEDIKLAEEYAGKIWDTANAFKAQAAAEKLIPERQESARYAQETKDLKTALDADKITRDEFNKATERAEQQHQSNLAKIRSDAVVSPQQEAAGTVDPVQQLANENARKLALIKQFESDKTITEQQGIALRSAANRQYEQQRVEAQWEIWRQQSVGNEVAAAAFDSFAGNASNALTGILTGSMSVSDAMRSLGATVLNSVINSFVQMGVEWAKSVIMGQVGMTAAASVASAQGAVIASAMAPAAAFTSLATAGANAVPAQAGIGATVGLAQGLAIAGARKNGGPVSAGEMYRVGEGGMPELYKASTGKQYMIPGDNGKVISNKDMQTAGGGGGVVVNIQNYTSSNVDAQATQGENGVTIDVIVADISNGGRIGQAISSFHQAPRRATQ